GGPGVVREVHADGGLLQGGVVLPVVLRIALPTTGGSGPELGWTLGNRGDQLLASAVIAANFGTLALVFSFVPFGTAAGMQFWFLEGGLHGAMAKRPRVMYR